MFIHWWHWQIMTTCPAGILDELENRPKSSPSKKTHEHMLVGSCIQHLHPPRLDGVWPTGWRDLAAQYRIDLSRAHVREDKLQRELLEIKSDMRELQDILGHMKTIFNMRAEALALDHAWSSASIYEDAYNKVNQFADVFAGCRAGVKTNADGEDLLRACGLEFKTYANRAISRYNKALARHMEE